MTAMYSSAPTIPTARPTTSLAAMTRSRLGVTTNVEFAVPWRYSFVDSSAPSVNMKTIARCVPMTSVATLRSLQVVDVAQAGHEPRASAPR